MLVPHWMGDESWRSPAFLQSLLVSLDSDISSRYKQFLVSVSAGESAARNRRRKACGRDLLSCILRALAISAESALNSGDVGRRRDCISLSEIIQERLTEINADSFVWTKSVPLVPNVDFESVLATYCEAAGSAFEDLGQSQSGSSTDRPVVATPARPSASSSARSRSPVSRDPEHSLRVVVPITPRPSIGGFPTPIPPSPRPVVSGQRTPIPPKAKAKPNSGHPRSPVLPPQQPVAEALDQPDEEGETIAPAAPVAPPRPLPLSELHRYDSGLVQVTQWFERVISLGFRYLLALDQHKVADRNVSQTRDIVRAALAERTIVVVCSFIPDSSFLSHGRNAQALWNPIIADIAEYPRPLPIIVTSKPLYRWGKASCLRHLRDQLWHQQQASFDSWVHVDDRLDIVREIDAERGLRGVHWDVRDRRSLLELCRAEGVL